MGGAGVGRGDGCTAQHGGQAEHSSCFFFSLMCAWTPEWKEGQLEGTV